MPEDVILAITRSDGSLVYVAIHTIPLAPAFPSYVLKPQPGSGQGLGLAIPRLSTMAVSTRQAIKDALTECTLTAVADSVVDVRAYEPDVVTLLLNLKHVGPVTDPIPVDLTELP